MKEFKKILFPVDLSESSEKIVPFVQTMAEKFDSKIYLFFAARVFDYFTSIYVPHPSINKFEKEIIEGAEMKLYEFADAHFGKFSSVKTSVVAGDAAEKIIDYIEDQKIDLVIMSAHEEGRLERYLFGPSVEELTRRMPCSILLVSDSPLHTV